MRLGAWMLAATAIVTLGLSACAEDAGGRRTASRGGGAEGLCKPFSNTGQGASAMPGAMADGAMAVDDCLHRWGYTLAKSDDDAQSVAAAVVAACAAPLARWNQQSLAAAAGGNGGGLQQAPSLLTGEPTNPILEHNNFAEGRALFYVVQARAGDCDPPRVDDDNDDRRREGNAQAPAQGYPSNSPDR